MEFLRTTARLAEEAAGMLVYFWALMASLIVGLVATLVIERLRRESRVEWRQLLVFSPMAFAVSILAWAALMEHPSHAVETAPLWPRVVLLALLTLQTAVGIWVVCAMSGRRWSSTFAVALQECFGVACTFVGVMAVTGHWL